MVEPKSPIKYVTQIGEAGGHILEAVAKIKVATVYRQIHTIYIKMNKHTRMLFVLGILLLASGAIGTILTVALASVFIIPFTVTLLAGYMCMVIVFYPGIPIPLLSFIYLCWLLIYIGLLNVFGGLTVVVTSAYIGSIVLILFMTGKFVKQELVIPRILAAHSLFGLAIFLSVIGLWFRASDYSASHTYAWIGWLISKIYFFVVDKIGARNLITVLLDALGINLFFEYQLYGIIILLLIYKHMAPLRVSRKSDFLKFAVSIGWISALLFAFACLVLIFTHDYYTIYNRPGFLVTLSFMISGFVILYKCSSIVNEVYK